MSFRARPLVLAAPSGTGKTTIAHRLVGGDDDFVFSVSATTRSPRSGERHGVDYDFVDENSFREMAEDGELVEWAEVHGRMYGTPRERLDQEAAAGRHVVLDIDVQGAAQIRERVPDALLVFVLPPSVDALLERLTARGTENRAELARRLKTALRELDAVDDFDEVVINDDLDRTVDAIRGFVHGRRTLARPEDMRAQVARLREGVERVLREQFADPASSQDVTTTVKE